LKTLTKLFLIILLVIFTIQCGEKKEEGPKKNTPPTVTEVSIIPLKPTIQTEIKAHILATDKDNDPITYRVKWFVNGEEIGEGMSFRYEEIKKGDKIYAQVTPYDGKDTGKSVASNEIAIGNVAPRVLSINVKPNVLDATTKQITIEGVVEDLDQDSVYLVCSWHVNDSILPDTSTTLNLQPFNLKRGDRLGVAAFADDGELRSDPFTSDFIVANAAPVLVAEEQIAQLRTDSIYYPLPIADPDGDPITFEIIEAPEGIEINREQGIVYGGVQDTTGFQILIRATDSEGGFLETKFTLTPSVPEQP
jgi:hypothetical protein